MSAVSDRFNPVLTALFVIALVLPLSGGNHRTAMEHSGGQRSSQPGAVDRDPVDEAFLVEAGRAQGLTCVHDAGELGEYPMPRIMGAGATLFDFDGDGRLDGYPIDGGSLQSGPTNHHHSDKRTEVVQSYRQAVQSDPRCAAAYFASGVSLIALHRDSHVTVDAAVSSVPMPSLEQRSGGIQAHVSSQVPVEPRKPCGIRVLSG